LIKKGYNGYLEFIDSIVDLLYYLDSFKYRIPRSQLSDADKIDEELMKISSKLEIDYKQQINYSAFHVGLSRIVSSIKFLVLDEDTKQNFVNSTLDGIS